MYLRKDEALDALAEIGNVAQFVSFEPTDGTPRQAFLRVLGSEPNTVFSSPRLAISALLARAPEGQVNVRSYSPESPRSREFLYGLSDVDEVVAAVERLTREGLHTIVNETVDVHDGGVSGVVEGGVIEFAPDDTPRCVEKPGTASMPVSLGIALLDLVYGFPPDFGGATGRIEFSIHPRPRGWRAGHTLLWEQETTDDVAHKATLSWPNRFSRHIGDKVYGLLMAHLMGAPVPATRAIPRRVAPFAFGSDTGSKEIWIRTCPMEQRPGLFTTHRGWLDPYRLLASEDPDGTQISSVLAQSGVPARYAGASLVDADGGIIIEGVAGHGDGFMLGTQLPEALPPEVANDVRSLVETLIERFGPVRTEWVYDGTRPWIVQLHRGATQSTQSVLVPGDAECWIDFIASNGLEALRELLATLNGKSGIQIVGAIGITSHMADLVRKAGVPTRATAK